MRDSLLSRFRGAFLGVSLGEAMGIHTSSYQDFGLAWRQIFRGQLGKSLEASACSIPASGSGTQLMLAETSALIYADSRFVQNAKNPAAASLPIEPLQPQSNYSFTAGEAILAMLPLALLYHDQPLLYRTVLQQAMSQRLALNEPLATPTMAAVMVSGHVVSLILRERFTRLELIPQLLRDLDLQESFPALAHQLMQVQAWVEQSLDLARVSRQVKQWRTHSTDQASLAIGLALYSFLATPEDFQLSLLRSAQLSPLVLVPTLTGAISGLYNGLPALPISWRRQTWSGEKTELLQRWGTASEAEVEYFADCLLACWSGAVDPAAWLQQSRFNCITAAPRAIRSDSDDR